MGDSLLICCIRRRFRRPDSSDLAGHILAAAERRFDFAVTVGAFGYLDLGAVIEFQAVVDQGGVAFGAGGVDGHTAFVAFVGSHLDSFL